MTKSAYGASAREIGELFADYVEGGAERPMLVLSWDKLGGAARTAVENSMEAFGYEPDTCTFATVKGLDPQAVFLLVEGLDPLYVIAADGAACDVLGRAYRQEFPADAPIRILGRNAVAFRDLAALMATPQLKQRAWSLLKTLKQ